MPRDLHARPFDEGTKAKLAIFRDYLREWLPVFLARKDTIWKTINIYDFFSGPGTDNEGNKGTPLIILDELSPYLEIIVFKKLNVNLYFNEYDRAKFDELKKVVSVYSGATPPFSTKIRNLDFKDAFEEEYPLMNKSSNANLLFLDQTGIKHINEDVFAKIIQLKRTDFLFFISSSTIKRFVEHPFIIQYIKMNTDDIEKTSYHKFHRLVLEYYRSLIPSNKTYYLAPFSLKKNAGLYGLIFGSGHVLGIEKFLRTCWSIDPDRGEANFDIDEDRLQKGQLNFFIQGLPKPKKVDLFEKDLKQKILNGSLGTNMDVYLFTLTNGFLPSHARVVIRQLIDEKRIEKLTLELKAKICKPKATLQRIKLI